MIQCIALQCNHFVQWNSVKLWFIPVLQNSAAQNGYHVARVVSEACGCYPVFFAVGPSCHIAVTCVAAGLRISRLSMDT